MARRMSSKERIQRLALEAEITAKEKDEKRKPKSATSEPAAAAKSSGAEVSKKKAAPPPKRQKLVWKVFNASYKEVAVFAYPQKADADAMAAKLMDKSGQPHFVNSVSVPMES